MGLQLNHVGDLQLFTGDRSFPTSARALTSHIDTEANMGW